ncbi:hypothetical protein KZ829_28440 [Actinoplanes hulinensis]|uniref:Uncharacterized protein n=1 Tax=Actinoplanes hulinensis TaxID=1144547 RepID=A0ABS7B9J1_9ACTN|nr:hypothetical protein [Actinoplanes hulinensis]MBW6437670.1 hypothetical protein [Actinoplanes hulinensis]
MSVLSISMPPLLSVPADQMVGRVLHVPAGSCRYRSDGLVLLVRHVRLDISWWYGGFWVWVEGDELAEDGYRLRWTQALVHVTACDLGALAGHRAR